MLGSYFHTVPSLSKEDKTWFWSWVWVHWDPRSDLVRWVVRYGSTSIRVSNLLWYLVVQIVNPFRRLRCQSSNHHRWESNSSHAVTYDSQKFLVIYLFFLLHLRQSSGFSLNTCLRVSSWRLFHLYISRPRRNLVFFFFLPDSGTQPFFVHDEILMLRY